MANSNGLGFLGRVPIDTVLVGLLDAVSKGELPAAAVSGPTDGAITSPNGVNGHSTENPPLDRSALSNGENSAPSNADSEITRNSFPLLDKYLETTSSKVWRDIATKVVDGIEARKADITSRLAATSLA